MLVEPGTLLGPVELGRLLDKEKNSCLYEGRHTRLDLNVVVRVARGLAEGDRDRYLDELFATTRLRNPAIIRAIDFGLYGDLRYLVSLQPRAETLEAKLAAARDVFAEALIWRLLGEAAQVLSIAHAAGVAHRELFPARVHLDADGSVRLGGFGFAPAYLDPSFDEMSSGRGRTQYLPHECVTRRQEIGPAADLFALGVIAYELAFQRLPFPLLLPDGPTDATVLAPARTDGSTHCSSQLLRLIGRLIEPDPGARLATAAGLLEQLPAAPDTGEGLDRDRAPDARTCGVGTRSVIARAAASKAGPGSDAPEVLSRWPETAPPPAAGTSPMQASRDVSEEAVSGTPNEFLGVAEFLQRRFGSASSRFAGGAVLHSNLRERFLVWALLIALSAAGAAALAFS